MVRNPKEQHYYFFKALWSDPTIGAFIITNTILGGLLIIIIV